MLLLVCPILTFAVTTYNGPSNLTAAAWNNPANWSSGIPNPCEEVRFQTAVTITEALPMGAGNDVDILGSGSLTVASGVTVRGGNLWINGPSGAFINNGVANFNNITYSSISPNTVGASITNNGTLSARNLNIGGGNTYVGTFTNNGSVSISMDIVIEEGTITNNQGASISSMGLDVRPGGVFDNYGANTSAGPYISTKIVVNAGGTSLADGVIRELLYRNYQFYHYGQSDYRSRWRYLCG